MSKLFALMLILAFAMSTAVNAAPVLGPESSWSEIRSTPNVYGQPPLIFFGNTGVPVTDVCIVEGRFRATNRKSITSEVPVATHRLAYDIEVVEVFGNGDHPHTRVLFLKHLDIPACT